MTLTILVALSGWVVQIVDVSTLSHTAYLMVKTACWAVHTASGGTHPILLEWTCASTVLPPFPRCPPLSILLPLSPSHTQDLSSIPDCTPASKRAFLAALAAALGLPLSRWVQEGQIQIQIQIQIRIPDLPQ